MQAFYVTLMMVSGLLAVWRGGPALLLCAAVVFYNWCFNTFMVIALHDTDAVIVFLVSDVVSLALVLKWADSAWLQQLAATYAGQIIMHLIKIVGDGDPYYYWQVLTVLGYAQLSLIAAGSLLRNAPVYRDAGHGLR